MSAGRSMKTDEQHRGIDPARLSAMLERARELTVWVVGDIILDEYIMGDANRVSPEAPVPVVRVRNTDHRLGGAANVAGQVAVLGARAMLAGVIGQDEAANTIVKLCEKSGIDTHAIRRLADRASSRKLRVLAQQQQLVRLDWEDTAASPVGLGHEIVELLAAGPAPDVVILSDYAKGMLTPELIDSVTHVAASAGVRVIVDPKRSDFSAYRGASVITPNLHELEIATGSTFDPGDMESIAAAARSLAQVAGAEALVVTLGAHGMLVVPVDESHQTVPAWRRSVFDTTGAGDTVVALVAVALAAGATLLEAAQIANAAASITVGSVGTVSVESDEIIGVLAARQTRKVFDRDGLAARVRRWRGEGRRIVFANGCFDLLHAGHLSLLHEAARRGDILIVGINSDASIGRLKGPRRPLIPESERAAMLAALECVDAVTIFAEDTPLELLQAIRPDVLVKGQDYRIDQVVGHELVESGGGQVVLVPLLPERSTTALIDRIADQHAPAQPSGLRDKP